MEAGEHAPKEPRRNVFFENYEMDKMAQHFVNIQRYGFSFINKSEKVPQKFSNCITSKCIGSPPNPPPHFRYRDAIIIPKNMGPVAIKTNEEKLVETMFESCAFKSFMACTMGEPQGGEILKLGNHNFNFVII